MDPMRFSTRLSLAEEAVSGPLDPRTGVRIRPLGVRRNGRLIWPIMGGAEDDKDSAGGGGTDDDDNDDDSSGDDDKSSEDGKKDADKDGDPKAKIDALTEEKDRQYRRRKEAETKAERLERELEELRGKDQDDSTKTAAKIESLQGEVETLTTALRDTRLENAFLQDNTYSWHNPGRALRLADLSKVDIDTDGSVHGLKEALDSLAKSDDYLLKKEESKDKDEGKNNVSTDADKKNSSKRDKGRESADAQRAALHDKYPALRR